jgi:hypothetical protein
MRSGKPELDETKRQNTARRSGKTHQCAAATLYITKRGGITQHYENVAAFRHSTAPGGIPSRYQARRHHIAFRRRTAHPNQTVRIEAAHHGHTKRSGNPLLRGAQRHYLTRPSGEPGHHLTKRSGPTDHNTT